MLDVAKAMIAEGGPDAFTIRELGRRAKVSVTTIYAAYGDKEGLIAAAIDDYYHNLPISHTPNPRSVEAVLEAMDLASEAIFTNKPYARHYANLFFSSTVDPRIYKVIQDTATASTGQLPWFEKLYREDALLPGLEPAHVASLLANHRLMVLHDWASGRIKDADLVANIEVPFLIFARGMTRGPEQAKIEAALKKMLRTVAAKSRRL